MNEIINSAGKSNSVKLSQDADILHKIFNMNNQSKYLLMLHCFILCITSYFFLHFDYFILCDYPDFLARINLYNHLSDTQHILSEYYYKNFQITPYMGFPTIVSFLEPLVGIYLAGKLFLVFAISVIISGGVFLNYTLYHRITPFSLFLHIFIFNYSLSVGLMNFNLGIGLVLWGFAFWLRYNNNTYKFYALFAFYSVVIFFCHVFCLFLLGVLIGLHHLSLKPITSVKEFFKASFEATIKVLKFTAIPMMITLCISGNKDAIGFPLHTEYEPFLSHFLGIYAFPLLFESAWIALWFITTFIILIILKKIDFKQPFIIVCLVIMAFFVPCWVLGIAGVNVRIPVLIGLLFAVSATFKGQTKHIIFCSVLTGIFSIYFYINNIQMLYHHNLEVSEFIATIKDDPNLQGKKLLSVDDGNHYTWGRKVQYSHFASYALIEANMFVPELITFMPPISLDKKYSYLFAPVSTPIFSGQLRLSSKDAEKYTYPYKYPFRVYWKNWRQDFDYVLWIHFDNKPKDIPSALRVYKQGSFFTIYKINKKGES